MQRVRRGLCWLFPPSVANFWPRGSKMLETGYGWTRRPTQALREYFRFLLTAE